MNPPSCRVRPGRSNVLLIAPHGGRRPATDPTAPRERKVNDLHTADLTAELAEALDATAIINDGCDRNDVDLNRIGQVRQRAPWFLDLLIERLSDLLGRDPDAQVLVVHGWNVVQAKCDLGVGGTEAAATGLVAIGDAALSISPAYWRTRVAMLRAAGAAAGIVVTVGERYPAANQSNLLQAFTPRFAASTDPRLRQLAEWAQAGRINALQLELGIPLRWPGPLRTAVRAVMVQAFGPNEPTRAHWERRRLARGAGQAAGETPVLSAVEGPALPAEPPPLLGALGFHFHDPNLGVSAFTSIAPMGTSTGGRLLLFLGGQEIALFTGEEPGRQGAVGGLAYSASDDGMRLRFAGYATRLADAGLYLDLEAALAASVLAEIELDLRYTNFDDRPDAPHGDARRAAARPGRFTGRLRIDGRDQAVDARGFCDPGVALRGPGSHAARTHLSATFDDHTAFNLRIAAGERTPSGVIIDAGAAGTPPLADLDISWDGDGETPRAFTLQFAGAMPPVVTQPLACMPIIRPLGDGAYARVTFGPARFDWGGRIGWGVYEFARRINRGS